ncbi:hypothetical protein AVEN_136359-1 [Araneus ventricosus]|uniref:Uncharacterized protein n=1 Tax=Araneus ventricosus TaxID=182803 RepID=A0A4Y2E3R4_ARAVE|nr:hypothetical protein AVEN_136359-1 [Araneus ventricosus]
MSWPRYQRAPGSKSDFIEEPRVSGSVGLMHAKRFGAKLRPAGVARKLGEGTPTQVSPSPSDHSSKVQGQPQNSPRVVSKRNVNIAKLSKP